MLWNALTVRPTSIARLRSRPVSSNVATPIPRTPALATSCSAMNDSLLWAFEQNYHLDKANACVHCAPVKFSTITFRLFAALEMSWPKDKERMTPEMIEVCSHVGEYELDEGL